MTPDITLVHDHMGPQLLRYADVLGRTLKDTVRRAAKGVNRRIIAITPPGSEGITGAAAYRQGRKKIAGQMNAVFIPVRIKGRRQIKKVFGHTPKRPVYVPTRERYPDVAAIYRQRLHARATGVGIVSSRGAKAYVDVRKFNAVLTAKQSHVGRLASGWAPGAAALDVPVQQWITRHGTGRGAIREDLNGADMRITVINHAAGLPPNLAAEMDRRIAYALRYQRNAMQREIEFYGAKVARDLAIKTGNFAPLVPPGMFGGAEAA